MVRDGDLAAGVRAFGTFDVKCLIVINDLARAGAEKQASLLACGLKGLGWTVSVVLIKSRNDFAGELSAAIDRAAAAHDWRLVQRRFFQT